MKPTITGSDLKAARLAAGFTLEQLSVLLCVTPSAISHWETGRNGISRVNHWRLNGVLDLTPTQDKAEEAPPAQEAKKWEGRSAAMAEAAAKVPSLHPPTTAYLLHGHLVIRLGWRLAAELQRLARAEYRTPEAQVSWIVKQHLAGRGGEG